MSIRRYVRIKRRNQTFCLLCDRGSTIADVKRNLEVAVKQHPGEGDDSPTRDSMRLLHETNVLDDESTLEKLELKEY